MELMRRFKVLRHFWARAARVRNRTGARIQMRPLAAPPTSQVRGLLPLLVSDTGPTTWTTRCPSSPTNQARSAWRWPGAGGVQAAQAPAASRSLCTSCRRRFPMVPREGARGLPQLGVVCVCVCVCGGRCWSRAPAKAQQQKARAQRGWQNGHARAAVGLLFTPCCGSWCALAARGGVPPHCACAARLSSSCAFTLLSLTHAS